jgi:subtilisin family serine protease
MKKPLLLLLFISQFIWSQQQDYSPASANFVPGKIIVKLKDNVNTKISYTSKGVGSTTENIGKLLGLEKKVSSSTVMFNQQSVEKSTMRKQSGFKDSRLKEVHSLKNIFKLDLKDSQQDVLSLIEDLKKNPDVEYAEPDYIFSVNDFTVDSKINTEADLKKLKTTSTIVIPNDPLYSQQSNISATHIDEVWNTYGTGNGSQIVAVLDTGVDYNHPDLQPNIWTNTAELNGITGFDDDRNGFIDDIRGWDFINNDNSPLDDNMHGTHVAGIIGAVGGNGIGIAGAAWNVKLMPLKIFQSNGVGNASTIALAIQYASNKGATIINMSFGSTAESITMRNALENAYATSVLVGSAGNSGKCIGPGKECAPSYPGAYSFVLGVEDMAKYSNYDQDGATFSKYPNLLNYELKSPGSAIMSTVPGGGYRTLTGTSMSAPLVSGGIALYLQQKPQDSKELLFGNLINTSTSFVNFKAAIEIIPTPQLKVISAINKDNSNGQNGNGFLEPNEIIDILPLVKNYWGPTDDVRLGIEFAEFEDPTKATFIQSEIAIGSITAYASLQDLVKTLKIQIAPNVANNVNIKFNLKVWSGPNKDYLTSTPYMITVKNAIILYGYITQNLTLSPGKEYLFETNVVVSGGATLTIEAGTLIKMGAGKRFIIAQDSKIFSNGTPENPVSIEGYDSDWRGIEVQTSLGVGTVSAFQQVIKGVTTGNIQYYDRAVFNYTNFKNIGSSIGVSPFFNGPAKYDNCSFEFFTINFNTLGYGGYFNRCKFNEINNMYRFYYLTFGWYGFNLFVNSNFSNINKFQSNTEFAYVNDSFFSTSKNNILLSIDYNNNLGYDLVKNPLLIAPNTAGTYDFPSTLWIGTNSKKIMQSKMVLDFYNSDNIGQINYDTRTSQPFAENHGVVWKVLVDGKDAQDEYDLMDPIGIGTHKFEVYFNRAMDITTPPQISYGVRAPYTQKIISEAGTWSLDAKIFTVNHEVKIGVADGISRIRIQNARDNEFVEIPNEDWRFNMLVQSAGSASVGFEAVPGLGKIALDWNSPSDTVLEDVLGYNMYRYVANTDGTFSVPVKINTNLITIPSIVDYNVVEGKTYYYEYKILRTSFEETDYSMTVAASPLTSMLGDSNGDFSVNVMDLVQSVDYILGNNPTPYIFLAADVNADKSINVLDIVGTVDIVLKPKTGRITSGKTPIAFYSKEAIGNATFYWEGNDLFVESDHTIGGLQLAFNTDFEYTKSAAITTFEALSYKQDDQKVIMIYSFNGAAIPAGKTKLFTKNDSVEGLLDISKAVVGMPNGRKLNALYKSSAVPGIVAPLQTNFSVITNLYPNPTNGNVTIQYYLPEKMDKVTFSVFDLQGKRIWNQNNYKNTSGNSTANLELNSLSNNMYFLVMDVERNGELIDRIVKKLIIKK